MMMIIIFLILISIAAIGLSIFLIFKLAEWDKKVVAMTVETKQQIGSIHKSFCETRTALKNVTDSTNNKVEDFKRGISDILAKLAGITLLFYIKKCLKK